MRPAGFRYANIGLAVSCVILAVGVFVLRDAGEAAMQTLAIGAFLTGMLVYLSLFDRAKRRKRRGQ
jgi:uncharacterized membrane protein